MGESYSSVLGTRCHQVAVDPAWPAYALRCGIKVDATGPGSVLSLATQRVRSGQSVHICTVNPEIVQLCRRDLAYRAAVGRADFRTIDGIGIALAVLRHHGQWPERLTGVTFTREAIEWARENSMPVLIVGASESSRTLAEDRLRGMGVQVVPGASPDVSPHGASGASIWNSVRRKAVLVLVALGVPKQEFWIRHQIEAGAEGKVFAGIGGVVDYLAGAAKEPPHIIRQLGMEWLFRLVREPRKRARRQIESLPGFVVDEML